MIINLPFQGGSADDAFATTLNSVTYVFVVHWNYRENAWYFDLQDSDQNPIISNVKIVLGCFLGRTGSVSPLADGIFVAVDTTQQGKEATFDDLGKRVQVRYIPAEDVAANLRRVRTLNE